MFQLIAKSGTVRGTSWPIEPQQTLVIGRESGCAVRIPDPVVSRRHCEITLVDDVVHLRDLGSVNPTLVNGKPVASCSLQIGDEIRIGRVVFLLARANGDLPGSKDDQQRYLLDTLGEEDSVYLSSHPPGDGVEVQPQTDEDLAELFHLSRVLSRTTNKNDLIVAVGEAIGTRLEPDNAWLLLSRTEGGELVALSGQTHPASPPDRALLMSTLARRNGVLTPERVAREGKPYIRCVMAAPVFFGDYDIGVLAVQTEKEERAYHKKDLHLFVALAHIVAPFFKAIERVEQLEVENRRLRVARQQLTSMVGSSKAMARVQHIMTFVAPTLQPVLILGATGTGKELAATLIHDLSNRAQQPLITVNCAAIPRDLFESEFFGHEKGAFTGAISRKIGLLEQSHAGTLFLDEIGDLSLEHQARILRAVETGRFRRVGGEEELSADFRLIAATNKDLAIEMQNGRFREDLYHRLKAVEIRIPPLTERRCDIPELAKHFLEAACVVTKGPERRFSPKAIEYLVNLPWPGNVRELKNTVAVANTLSKGDLIDVDDLRAISTAHDTDNAPLPLCEVERLHIIKALEYTNRNMGETARLLGIGRSTLYNKLSDYGMK